MMGKGLAYIDMGTLLVLLGLCKKIPTEIIKLIHNIHILCISLTIDKYLRQFFFDHDRPGLRN